MTLTKIVLAGLLSIVFTSVSAYETENEKSEAAQKDLSRTTDKAVNRVKEALCTEGDVECLKQKAEHRIEESTDAIKDKANEEKNKIDE